MGYPSPEFTVVFQWTLATITLLLLLARGYFRVFRLGQSLLFSDYFLVAGWLVSVGIAVLTTVASRTGELEPPEVEVSPAFRVTNLKLVYTLKFILDFGIFFPKASLLSFYLRMMPVTESKTRKALLAVAVYTLLTLIITVLINIFWCRPTSLNWLNPEVCWVVGTVTPFSVQWALNITSDIMILILPFPSIWNMNLPRREYRALIGIFSLGVITIFVSTGRYMAIMIDHVPTIIWTLCSAEHNTVLIVTTLPAFGILLRKARTEAALKEGSFLSSGPSGFMTSTNGSSETDEINQSY